MKTLLLLIATTCSALLLQGCNVESNKNGPTPKPRLKPAPTPLVITINQPALSDLKKYLILH